VRVVIPVAGIGTRLRPLTDHVPKVLLPVADRPILGHILSSLGVARPSEVALVVGYRAEQVRDYATAGFDLPFRFVQQEEQKGLGHAVLQALDPAHDGESLLVLLGDTIFDVDFGILAARDANLLGVHRVPDPRRFGIAVLSDGKIARLVEKPEQPLGDLALVGIYRVRRAGELRQALLRLIERGITTRGEYQLTDGLQLMLESGVEFEPFEVEGWFDCGTPEILLETNRVLLRRLVAGGAGRDSREGSPRPAGVGRDAAIVPPVHIGPRVELGESVLGPHVAVGEGSRVRRAVLRDSIVGRNAVIEDAVLERAIVGDGAQVRGRPVTGMIAPAADDQNAKGAV
jgi:glucose-1-phosphate thymidylyltransferase